MSPANAVLTGGFTAEDAPAWQRIRRYAVPGWMIEQATAHRLAGDWRAACATAAVDVGFELPDVEARYGAAVAEAVAEDLRYLAPDLLRWHLPRLLGGRTTIAPDLRIVLATYGGPGGPALSVTTPLLTEGSQRLRLQCAPVAAEWNKYTGRGFVPEDWTSIRPFWDARRASGLGTRFAEPEGLAERIARLRATGDTVGAFEAAGVTCDLTVPTPQSYQRPADPEALLAQLPVDLTRLAAETVRLVAAGAGDRYRIPVNWRCSLLLEPAGPGALRARVIEVAEAAAVPLLPRYAWQRLPDLELVRTGRISPRELHPLVAAALFPEAGPAVGPPGPDAGAPVRVRCRGGWHEVRSRGGVLDVPHTPEEQQRERAMRAFGGTVSGCFAVQQSWTTGGGRLPRGLRAQRHELFLRVQHGDTPGVMALLDAGVDPRIRDARRRGLLHGLHLLDHEVLLPRLLAAGLDLEARDKAERTPLLSAVHWGGSAELVRALLAAGARIDVIDEMELSLSQEIRRYKRTDLTFLRNRVDEEFPDIGADWFDEHMEYREEEEGEEDHDEAEEDDDA
ncbi:ankyrin repeat domain-containing protein [Streptomyces erythrochromogenes]|uniref:Ankyrin repeat domain-containing protein n=1 Tax=Streptomyces erythrochromogenes TaxID=285574 RepID=A0ABZ1QMX2_9ACTN|nr:ankyrin repeat domain-containing protein [Streptomyces erythrochromogenes]MCX5588841.1 ankyrin repeat domain-containing protein [Streptomyces erythrochromogenes]